MTGPLTVTGLPGLHDFEAGEGSAVGLYGEPGTGKSAALLAIAGVRGSEGAILLGGVPLRPVDVGLMRQDVGLLPELTAAENVSLPLMTRRTGGRRRKVEAVLEAMRLPPATWYNLAEELSGGQQQRVGIARALVAAPPLICLDEPFTELDGATAEAVWAALRAARADGAVTVVTTTDPRIAERCDVVVPLLGDGEGDRPPVPTTRHVGRHVADPDHSS